MAIPHNIYDREYDAFDEGYDGRAVKRVKINDIVYRSVNHYHDSLRNSGSNLMNVNGSVTPVIFDYVATQEDHLVTLSLAFESTGAIQLNNFGGLAALINGVLFESNIGGVAREIATLRNNGGLSNFFGDSHQISQYSGAGLGGARFLLTGIFKTEQPLKLNPGDSIRATVRDDLSGITYFRVGFHVWRYV
jgi:hypothetical protein